MMRCVLTILVVIFLIKPASGARIAIEKPSTIEVNTPMFILHGGRTIKVSFSNKKIWIFVISCDDKFRIQHASISKAGACFIGGWLDMDMLTNPHANQISNVVINGSGAWLDWKHVDRHGHEVWYPAMLIWKNARVNVTSCDEHSKKCVIGVLVASEDIKLSRAFLSKDDKSDDSSPLPSKIKPRRGESYDIRDPGVTPVDDTE